MNVKWEKRGHKYYCYFRQSDYDRETGKTSTVNKYLGATIKIAEKNMRELGKNLNLSNIIITDLCKIIGKTGTELFIPYENSSNTNCIGIIEKELEKIQANVDPIWNHEREMLEVAEKVSDVLKGANRRLLFEYQNAIKAYSEQVQLNAYKDGFTACLELLKKHLK